MVNGSVGIHLIGQGRGASDLQNLIICKVEMKVAGSMGNGCQKRVELVFINLACCHIIVFTGHCNHKIPIVIGISVSGNEQIIVMDSICDKPEMEFERGFLRESFQQGFIIQVSGHIGTLIRMNIFLNEKIK